jgi:23S rRNA (cytidine1920-2'-O)/16S rRNA (cytidine1409-2'-O)-methyltransferase
VLVDGFPVRNPRSLVRFGARIELLEPRSLRGELKLQAALDAFPIAVAGRIALDVGAAAGGFTKALLQRDARRVYAVDAGHGQLLGSLRLHPRVVNLERTNLGQLTRRLVPEPVELVTIDVSYLPVAAAAPQLDRVEIAPRADLIALVKPMFELGLPGLPTSGRELETAVAKATAGVEAAGWLALGSIESTTRGTRGATEFFLHARRGP